MPHGGMNSLTREGNSPLPNLFCKDIIKNPNTFFQGVAAAGVPKCHKGMNVLHLLFSPWRRPRKLTFSASIKTDFAVGPLTAAEIISWAETQY